MLMTARSCWARIDLMNSPPASVAYTANQLIALNLARARKARGWTQEETAERLEPFLGTRWSVPSLSAIERSVAGTRIKQFSADEIVALARTFSVPIGWFFLPPEDEPTARFAASDKPDGHDFHLLVEVLLGTEEGRMELEGGLLARAAKHGSDDSIIEITKSMEEDRNLRIVSRLYEAFGDIDEAQYVLQRLAVALEILAPDIREQRFHRETTERSERSDTKQHKPRRDDVLQHSQEGESQGSTG